MSQPLVIAHRGASGERPENTLPAFERAIEQSADMIETDLHLTRDGVVVVHHDASLKRLGARGEIREWNAADLRSLDAAPDAPANGTWTGRSSRASRTRLLPLPGASSGPPRSRESCER